MDIIGETISIMSANVQGIRDGVKRFDVINYYQNLHPSILCLQDTHILSSELELFKDLWDGEILLNGKSTNSRGVAIFLSKSLEYKISNISRDKDGNLIQVDIQTNDISIRIVTIYSPNKDTPAFFDQINNMVDQNEQMYTLICGDFNLVLNPAMDTHNYLHINNPNARNKL